jgi:alkanesulfonate monooxygenase
MAVIARPDRAEALAYGAHLIESEQLRLAKQGAEKRFVGQSDSHSIKQAYQLGGQAWLTPTIWLEPVRAWGATNMTLLGSYDQVAAEIMALQSAGVTHFILSGWPKQEEMVRFGAHVIPRVRRLEARTVTNAVAVTLS